jgi:hypothetical protein
MRAAMGDDKALPPQIFNDDQYCGVSIVQCDQNYSSGSQSPLFTLMSPPPFSLHFSHPDSRIGPFFPVRITPPLSMPSRLKTDSGIFSSFQSPPRLRSSQSVKRPLDPSSIPSLLSPLFVHENTPAAAAAAVPNQ